MKLPLEMFIPGRVYGPEWSLENVARRLIFEANRGFLRGVNLKEKNRYRRQCSARHRGSNSSVIFTRDDMPPAPLGYHASLCFIGEETYEPWNEEIAERWLVALFGEDRPRVREYSVDMVSPVGHAKGVRHFFLEVDRW